MTPLAYILGRYEALMKLGATEIMPELTPAQKAYMQRLTEFDAPVPEGPLPALQKSKRHLRHLARTALPQTVGLTEDFKIMGLGRLLPEGLELARAQRQTVDDWLKTKGSQRGFSPVFRNLAESPTAFTDPTRTGIVPVPHDVTRSIGAPARKGTQTAALVAPTKPPSTGAQLAKIIRRYGHV
jgi:hypothetical protein